jgi:bacillithiol system protein YtxJ
MSFLNSIFGNPDPKDTPQNGLEWKALTEIKQLDDMVSDSAERPVILFKHSTTCGISRMALKNFEREYKLSDKDAKIYFLDLLSHRDISAAIAERFGVWHESPQLLVIENGKAVYNTSHSDISAEAVEQQISGMNS